MTVGRKKKAASEKLTPNDLLKRANAMPGVADLLRLYEQYSVTVDRATSYALARAPLQTSSAGTNTA